MNILCVSSSEIGLWMNIVWIYKWFKERSKGSKGSMKVQRSSIVQCVQGTFKSSKGSRVQKVQCVQEFN